MYKMDASNLELFTYFKPGLVENAAIKGIVIEFHGLGSTEMLTERWQSAEYAAAGGLYVYPYYGPWSWMNDVAVKYCDSVLDAVIARHSLKCDIPVISVGGSMGGLSAMVFARYSRHNITACAANSPVCDLPAHYSERPDLPQTMLLAFGHYDMPMKEALMTASPLHLVHDLPRIPYYIVHGDADTAVNKQLHSDRLVQRMREEGHDITYIEVPGMTHCNMDPEHRAAYDAFIKSHLK